MEWILFKYMSKEKAKIVLLPIILLFLIYYYITYSLRSDLEMREARRYNLEIMKYDSYLVQEENCLIPSLPPLGEDVVNNFKRLKYFNCSKLELLSYIAKSNGSIKLMIRKDLIKSYTNNNITCCYSYVNRKEYTKNPDDDLSYSKCEDFHDVVDLNQTTVIVKCKDKVTDIEIYKNAHAFTNLQDVKEKINKKNVEEYTMKILFIGIDSVSRLSLQRAMPLTYKHLRDNNWIEYQGYNKVGLNTFPNLMAIFTGRNISSAYSACNNKIVGQLDRCNLIWYDFNKLGFVTAYAEDTPIIQTFNFKAAGFKKSPTDFYFRPYMLAIEDNFEISKELKPICSGPETAAERIMNIATDFSNTFQNYSTFGIFWMNSFSHDDINSPTIMDGTVSNFLQNMKNDGIFDKHIVIFLSDHGMRFGDFRLTKMGWYEERLPFLEFWLPEHFRKKYANLYENLKANYNKLTTPYDLHMTLQHLLKIHNNNYTISKSSACDRCHSLFEPVSTSRRCQTVAIAEHYCTCTSYTSLPIDKSTKLSNATVNFVLEALQSRITKSIYGKHCAEYRLDKILSLRSSHSDINNSTHFILAMKTLPKAIFEATLISNKHYKDDKYNFALSGDISRLDVYANHSKCVNDAILKRYCYCLND